MKVWRLGNGRMDYAVVFAETEEEAKRKATKRSIGFCDTDEDEWKYCYEFTPDDFDGVLLFS